MPGINTHVNFARLVLARTGIPYDTTYFVMGSIAPDCFLEHESDEAFRLHHFVRIGSEPDLEFFLDVTHSVSQSSNMAERSFIDGYHTHLWLDVFVRTHGEDIELIRPPNVTEEEIRFLLKANVKRYDLTSIGDFLNDVKEQPQPIGPIPGMEFVSFELALKLLHQLVVSAKEVEDTETLPMIIAEEQHIHFLSRAADEFVKTFQVSR